MCEPDILVIEILIALGFIVLVLYLIVRAITDDKKPNPSNSQSYAAPQARQARKE
jgi:hypothetical protein